MGSEMCIRDRYIIAILPFILFYFFVGLKNVLYIISKKYYQFVFYILVAAILISHIFTLPLLRPIRKDYLNAPFKNFISLHGWIKENLSKEGIIASRKPTITYFYTNHKSIVYPYTLNPEEIWNEILKDNVKYIVVDEFSPQTYYYLLPFIRKYRSRLKLLHRVGNTGVFYVKGD